MYQWRRHAASGFMGPAIAHVPELDRQLLRFVSPRLDL
jgi:hypothetical protein